MFACQAKCRRFEPDFPLQGNMKRLITIIIFSFISCSAFAEAYVLYDMNEHSVIESSNSSEITSIASLTKLVTAMVCIDGGNCDERLLRKMLIRSDNTAAEMIAESYSTGRSRFITAMNLKVQSLGLKNTRFTDPSGLSVFNVSTAREYIDVVMAAESYPLIKKISSTSKSKEGKKRFLVNTNHSLLDQFKNIVLSKTGYTRSAGRCLALVVIEGEKKYAIVILGEQSPDKRTKTAKRLIGMTH